MAKRDSIFGNEWRRCLKEHYKYVIHNNDRATEQTLIPILYGFGFSDDELRQLYVEATMRDMPDDFLPDMQRAWSAADQQSFQTHPAECNCPACMDTVLESGHDSEGQPITEPEEAQEAHGSIFPVIKPDDDDSLPKQKRLF